MASDSVGPVEDFWNAWSEREELLGQPVDDHGRLNNLGEVNERLRELSDTEEVAVHIGELATQQEEFEHAVTASEGAIGLGLLSVGDVEVRFPALDESQTAALTWFERRNYSPLYDRILDPFRHERSEPKRLRSYDISRYTFPEIVDDIIQRRAPVEDAHKRWERRDIRLKPLSGNSEARSSEEVDVRYERGREEAVMWTRDKYYKRGDRVVDLLGFFLDNPKASLTVSQILRKGIMAREQSYLVQPDGSFEVDCYTYNGDRNKLRGSIGSLNQVVPGLLFQPERAYWALGYEVVEEELAAI